MALTPESPVRELPGVGRAREEILARLGIATAGDLLYHLPRSYEDRRGFAQIRTAPEGIPVCVRAMVAEPARVARIRKGLDLTRVRAVDMTGGMTLSFFNQSYVGRSLKTGEEYVFFGTVEGAQGHRQMTNPIFEPADQPRLTGRVMPVYPLTRGISGPQLWTLIQYCLDRCADQLPDTLPPGLRQRYALPGVGESLRLVHAPREPQDAARGRRRFIFEELLRLSCGMALLKSRRKREKGRLFRPGTPEEFQTLLPFRLTGAQRRAMEDVAGDTASGLPMNRLIQGDVGSGKTMVAAYAAWLAVKNGCQAALMAPTELLAEQHFQSLAPLLEQAGIRTALLTGSVQGAGRRALYGALAAGEVDFVIGTHALIAPGVRYADLGMVIADEQHRFGVAQRAALAEKSEGAALPHVLVMSATPIPRTLALMIYGDLDVSVLNELPPGRTPVETYVVGEDKRQRMYGFVRRLVGEGRQVYMVCPAVEESGQTEESAALALKAAADYAHQLQTEVFPDLRVGLVHGRMKPRDKEKAMSAFARGEADVLVSTTVIEVGVDVPNAALMVVENAERFGLSQLHQLRGRVGRGRHQSYCVLMTSSRSQESRQRLRVLASTTDGFRIAEEDLKLRGPGDFFGRRQHGLPALQIADLATDLSVLSEARQAAESLLEEDPLLSDPEHRCLRDRVRQMFADREEQFN